jgi:hypothetical protein
MNTPKENIDDIKIVKRLNPKHNEVGVSNFQITYWQEANTIDGDEDEGESLTLTMINGAIGEEDWFTKIETGKNGFTINKPEDFQFILNDFYKRFKM